MAAITTAKAFTCHSYMVLVLVFLVLDKMDGNERSQKPAAARGVLGMAESDPRIFRNADSLIRFRKASPAGPKSHDGQRPDPGYILLLKVFRGGRQHGHCADFE